MVVFLNNFFQLYCFSLLRFLCLNAHAAFLFYSIVLYDFSNFRLNSIFVRFLMSFYLLAFRYHRRNFKF